MPGWAPRPFFDLENLRENYVRLIFEYIECVRTVYVIKNWLCQQGLAGKVQLSSFTSLNQL